MNGMTCMWMCGGKTFETGYQFKPDLSFYLRPSAEFGEDE